MAKGFTGKPKGAKRASNSAASHTALRAAASRAGPPPPQSIGETLGQAVDAAVVGSLHGGAGNARAPRYGTPRRVGAKAKDSKRSPSSAAATDATEGGPKRSKVPGDEEEEAPVDAPMHEAPPSPPQAAAAASADAMPPPPPKPRHRPSSGSYAEVAKGGMSRPPPATAAAAAAAESSAPRTPGPAPFLGTPARLIGAVQLGTPQTEFEEVRTKHRGKLDAVSQKLQLEGEAGAAQLKALRAAREQLRVRLQGLRRAAQSQQVADEAAAVESMLTTINDPWLKQWQVLLLEFVLEPRNRVATNGQLRWRFLQEIEATRFIRRPVPDRELKQLAAIRDAVLSGAALLSAARALISARIELYIEDFSQHGRCHEWLALQPGETFMQLRARTHAAESGRHGRGAPPKAPTPPVLSLRQLRRGREYTMQAALDSHRMRFTGGKALSYDTVERLTEQGARRLVSGLPTNADGTLALRFQSPNTDRRLDTELHLAFRGWLVECCFLRRVSQLSHDEVSKRGVAWSVINLLGTRPDEQLARELIAVHAARPLRRFARARRCQSPHPPTACRVACR
jgi:hypothetical protein